MDPTNQPASGGASTGPSEHSIHDDLSNASSSTGSFERISRRRATSVAVTGDSRVYLREETPSEQRLLREKAATEENFHTQGGNPNPSSRASPSETDSQKQAPISDSEVLAESSYDSTSVEDSRILSHPFRSGTGNFAIRAQEHESNLSAEGNLRQGDDLHVPETTNALAPSENRSSSVMVDSDFGIKYALPPEKGYECELRWMSPKCNEKSHKFKEWVDHTLSHFNGRGPPDQLVCPFSDCPAEFREPVANTSEPWGQYLKMENFCEYLAHISFEHQGRFPGEGEPRNEIMENHLRSIFGNSLSA